MVFYNLPFINVKTSQENSVQNFFLLILTGAGAGPSSRLRSKCPGSASLITSICFERNPESQSQNPKPIDSLTNCIHSRHRKKYQTFIVVLLSSRPLARSLLLPLVVLNHGLWRRRPSTCNSARRR